MSNSDRITQNIAEIRRRIDEAAARAGRVGDDVTLVAVTKYQGLDETRAVLDAGHRVVGESRVQEAQEKIPALPEEFEWHMIGHIQSNKARFIPPLFHMAHSVDRVKVARALDKARRRQWQEEETPEPERRPFDILLQMNVSGEESKFGLPAEKAEAALEDIAALEAVRVQGLMTMAPHFEDPERTRPVFVRLRELRDRLVAADIPNAPLPHLSMGMSNDYPIAIEEGATIVRVGTAVFQ